MPDLISFLRARLDEDARVARSGPHGAEWHVDKEPWETMGVGIVDAADDSIAVAIGSYVADHIVRFDPARVLADVDAKRRIVAHIGTLTLSPWPISVAPEYVEDLNRLLRLLALPYAGHPEYREEWRPA